MKAQVSTEFIIIFAILLSVFLILYVTVDNRSDQLNKLKIDLEAKTIADRTSSEINALYLAGDGENRTVELPAKLKGEINYTLNIYPDSHIVEIVWELQGQTKHYASPIITAQIGGNLTSLSNDIDLSIGKGGIVIG